VVSSRTNLLNTDVVAQDYRPLGEAEREPYVAIQTFRHPESFQSPFTTRYAAMLFAVGPLRNALLGSPAFGSWVDLTIVLGVLVALVVSMLLFLTAWQRSLSKTRAAQRAEKT
jgi:hypothetical protein